MKGVNDFYLISKDVAVYYIVLDGCIRVKGVNTRDQELRGSKSNWCTWARRAEHKQKTTRDRDEIHDDDHESVSFTLFKWKE